MKVAKQNQDFFNQLNSLLFKSNFTIYCLETNTYTLYSKLKEREFKADIKMLLAELHPNKANILNQKFAYTYLIFDCDSHHTKKKDERSIREIVLDNFKKLKELASYFIDETDPTIGKLYINYPMMESYRDCDNFFDDSYKDTTVNINDIKKYKPFVNEKRLSGYDIAKYTSLDFKSLILQNLYKLSKISTNNWNKPSYNEYLKIAEPLNILNHEENFVKSNELIFVLNTALFVVIDYYGNRNGFYDNLIRPY